MAKGPMVNQPKVNDPQYSDYHVNRSTKNGGSKAPSGGSSAGH